MWRGAVVKVLEEKKNSTSDPSPLYYIKMRNNESKEEVSYWSAAQSQNSLKHHSGTQNAI